MQEYLKPKEGMIIRDPVTKIPLGAEGCLMEMTTFWNRRILDGTVDVIKTPQKKIIAVNAIKKEEDK